MFTRALFSTLSIVAILTCLFAPPAPVFGQENAEAARHNKKKKLKLDDGSQEQVIGILDGTSRQPLQTVVANRFTPASSLLPFRLDEAQILLPRTCQAGDTGLRETMTFELVVYVDPAGTGDPTNALLAHRQSFQVVPHDRKFVRILLSNPITITSGDVWIGFTNSMPGGAAGANYYAALDTKTTKQRSWIFYTPGTSFTGDSLATAQVRTLIDQEGIPGNWLIRGRGHGGSSRTGL